MKIVKIWVMTEEGIERDEAGLPLTRNHWMLQDAFIDLSEISHAYESLYHPGCITVELKTDVAMHVQMSILELYEAKLEYQRTMFISAFFQSN
ncbi:hypothetical protein FEM33_01545 [Dyadobacter flavalbus]|uniref:Uncharacterized protein n=1 Tax=Dyadobacter flavalbus TaxID=2579942 RepID=A0A5M8R374_9BACT|nr:hypothetical protein [Dyadobacter flavalbus]KAA6441444.1 hypothetical protein FEM33_01545 [Dyadobacter flavalbus]